VTAAKAVRPFRGTAAVPGDKSVSHRAVLFGALATGESRVTNFLHAEDTLRSAALARALGAEVRETSPTELVVTGRGLHALAEPPDVIDAGNSGTTIRIGSGILAGIPFLSVVTGDVYLRRRPMARVAEPLARMGATILGRDGNRLPPLCIRGGNLKGIDYDMPVASAQVKSAILLAGLFASSPVAVGEPLPSRDHTERLLSAMGAEVSRDGRFVSVRPAERLSPFHVAVPGDISSAAFFLVLAAAVPGSRIVLPGVGTNPHRTGIVDALRRMGASVVEENPRLEGGEPVADLVVEGGELAATEVPPEEVPSLVDEIPALCVAAAFAKGRTEVRGAEELRVKESDRIASMCALLSAFGVRCGDYPDGLWVEGGGPFRDASVDSRGDHRVAMAATVLAAAAGVSVRVSDTACVDTSFPSFFRLLEGLSR
jgi:3-phosphoshikimate 1-carboxyvinyltransferase